MYSYFIVIKEGQYRFRRVGGCDGKKRYMNINCINKECELRPTRVSRERCKDSRLCRRQGNKWRFTYKIDKSGKRIDHDCRKCKPPNQWNVVVTKIRGKKKKIYDCGMGGRQSRRGRNTGGGGGGGSLGAGVQLKCKSGTKPKTLWGSNATVSPFGYITKCNNRIKELNKGELDASAKEVDCSKYTVIPIPKRHTQRPNLDTRNIIRCINKIDFDKTPDGKVQLDYLSVKPYGMEDEPTAATRYHFSGNGELTVLPTETKRREAIIASHGASENYKAKDGKNNGKITNCDEFKYGGEMKYNLRLGDTIKCNPKHIMKDKSGKEFNTETKDPKNSKRYRYMGNGEVKSFKGENDGTSGCKTEEYWGAGEGGKNWYAYPGRGIGKSHSGEVGIDCRNFTYTGQQPKCDTDVKSLIKNSTISCKDSSAGFAGGNNGPQDKDDNTRYIYDGEGGVKHYQNQTQLESIAAGMNNSKNIKFDCTKLNYKGKVNTCDYVQWPNKKYIKEYKPDYR
tara:strand:+ start:345 stop:1868 length:1524 start_codon:yes stop_codon:yes gene_type:complete